MMISVKKLLLFVLKQSRIQDLKQIRFILSIALIFTLALGTAQDEDKSLKRSDDFIYQGNEKVSEDFVSAEMEYRKAVSVKPNNAKGSYNLGNAYYKSGLFDEALSRHLEAAKNATTKTEKHRAFHNIGNALMQQQQCKQAVEAFKNALRNNPSDEESRYNLALAQDCANKQGEGDDGEKDQKEDTKEDNKEDQENKENENKDDGDQNDDKENKDKGDDNEDKNDGDEKDDKGKPKDEKDNKNGEPNENKKQQPQQGKLSPQQVKNLLEAMNNEEKKVQDKINAKKAKGVKIKTEKDW